MTNQTEKTFDPTPIIDFSDALTVEIGRTSHGSDSVEITTKAKTEKSFYASRYGKAGMVAIVKQVREAAKERGLPYFNITKGSTWTPDAHMYYFSAPAKIKKLTEAQQRALVTFAKAAFLLDWYGQCGVPNPRGLTGRVTGEEAANNISTLRKLTEYGLIASNEDIASTWRQWFITEAGLAYVEANLPEDNKATWFKVWDDREKASLASDVQHDDNVEICRKLIANISGIELGNVGSNKDPFANTSFKWVLGGTTFAILNNSKVEIITPNYNSRRNMKSAFIDSDDVLVYAKAMKQIAVLMAEIAIYNASNS